MITCASLRVCMQHSHTRMHETSVYRFLRTHPSTHARVQTTDARAHGAHARRRRHADTVYMGPCARVVSERGRLRAYLRLSWLCMHVCAQDQVATCGYLHAHARCCVGTSILFAMRLRWRLRLRWRPCLPACLPACLHGTHYAPCAHAYARSKRNSHAAAATCYCLLRLNVRCKR